MKILAVCGFGCGSSMILRMGIEKVLKNLGVDIEVENTDLTGGRDGNADAIFTSYELADELENTVKIPIYKIMHYTNISEITEQVQKFLNENKK